MYNYIYIIIYVYLMYAYLHIKIKSDFYAIWEIRGNCLVHSIVEVIFYRKNTDI